MVKDALPGVDICPLFLDSENGTWVIRALFQPGLTLPKHFHTGTVHFYTMAGSWHYLEYPDQPQTAGSYLYEPGGSVHTFATDPDGEGADGFMVIQGCNVNFDEDGNFLIPAMPGDELMVATEPPRTAVVPESGQVEFP